MFCYTKVKNDLYFIGGSDRRLALFENVYPIPNGISYNSYFLDDEKTVVIDTVDKSVSKVFFENITKLLNKRPLDYLVINHMEPDHAATIGELINRYPDVTIVCNQKTSAMLKQYFDFETEPKINCVKENDTLSFGTHTFTFIMAPMVHWPEVMVSYDCNDKVLFSADAFGTFGAINGNIFADELNFDSTSLAEARRYYSNIVGKYGVQVQSLLSKAASLEIDMICPLHGPVWRENIDYYIEKYKKWSCYEPEENAVVIAYASVYGNTENAADIVACRLALKGVHNIKMFDVSVTHPSYIISEVFRASHIVIASTTYNNGIFVNMENLINDLTAHNIQNRTVGIIENGSWAPVCGKQIREKLSVCKNINILEKQITFKSSLKEEMSTSLDEFADALMENLG